MKGPSRNLIACLIPAMTQKEQTLPEDTSIGLQMEERGAFGLISLVTLRVALPVVAIIYVNITV